MPLDLTRITAAVTANTTVDGSAKLLMSSIAQKFRDALALQDPAATAALEALATALETDNAAHLFSLMIFPEIHLIQTNGEFILKKQMPGLRSQAGLVR